MSSAAKGEVSAGRVGTRMALTRAVTAHTILWLLELLPFHLGIEQQRGSRGLCFLCRNALVPAEAAEEMHAYKPSIWEVEAG